MNGIPVAEKREVNIGNWLAETWKWTTKDIGPTLLLGLVAVLILLVLGITFVGSVLCSMPIFCGLFLYCKKRMLGRPAELGDMFKGFEIFAECLIASLIILGFSLALGLVFGIVFGVIAAMGTCCPVAFLLNILLIPVMFLVSGAAWGVTVLVPGLLFERRMKAWDAIRLSYQFAMKNFWMISLYGCIVLLIYMLGTMITCGLGIILALPFVVFAGTVVYRDWIGFAEGGAEKIELIPTDAGPAKS
jgi:hypothetical protein